MVGSCKGCGYKHIEKVVNESKIKPIKKIGEVYFKLVSERRRGTGGRIPLDESLKLVLKEEIPQLEELTANELRAELEINGDKVRFKVKCDLAFKIADQLILIEVKNAGNDTNSILSAITAAQVARHDPKFKNALFYYIGGGQSRADLINKKRAGIYPYVMFAEKRGIIKFYGLKDFEEFIQELKSLCGLV